MSALRWSGWLLCTLLAGVAAAAGLADLGWTPGGEMAANSERVLAGPEAPVDLSLPRSFASSLPDSALIVYFSPTCSHCRHVARELQALDQSLPEVPLVWVGSGGASQLALDEFRAEFEITGRMVRDVDRSIATAMGARYTPSMLWVKRKGRALQGHGAWYPFRPGSSSLVELRLSEDPWSVFAPGEYHGNNTCGACHSQELESWKLTHHSVAWRTLERSNRQLDPECTSCHVTGAGEEGGWEQGQLHSPLVDVGCEACHGPGGPHDGERTETRSTCGGCHDDKHSIGFSVEEGMPLIDHYRATSMSEQEVRERRMALFDGEAPQEMVGLPEGETVGAAACAGCHEGPHAWWEQDPHRHAMARLEAEQAQDVACVRCHATPVRTGPPASSLEGYRLEEGVGCEACHGAGKAHVEAGGGTDNIQGLGDSCPVCVLEALCTSCHTAEWDPSWSLGARLPAVAHETAASSP